MYNKKTSIRNNTVHSFQGWCSSSLNIKDEDDNICQCFHGYGGFRCANQLSVGFNESDSFLALENWQGIPKRNLTLTLRTLQRYLKFLFKITYF